MPTIIVDDNSWASILLVESCSTKSPVARLSLNANASKSDILSLSGALATKIGDGLSYRLIFMFGPSRDTGVDKSLRHDQIVSRFAEKFLKSIGENVATASAIVELCACVCLTEQDHDLSHQSQTFIGRLHTIFERYNAQQEPPAALSLLVALVNPLDEYKREKMLQDIIVKYRTRFNISNIILEQTSIN